VNKSIFLAGPKVSVVPLDLAGVHISNLEKVVDLRVTGSAAAIDEVFDLPIIVVLPSSQFVVAHEHGHSWSHFHKDRAHSELLLGMAIASELANHHCS